MGVAAASPLPVHEAVSQPRELTVETPIDEQASDFGHEASEKLAVGDFLQQHLLAAEHAPEAIGQRRALGIAEPHRRADACADAPRALVPELAGRVGGPL